MRHLRAALARLAGVFVGHRADSDLLDGSRRVAQAPGIRMSLGADRGRVQRMILTEGGVLVVRGLVLGVVATFFASRVIQGLLYGVAPHDPVTLITVAVMMAAIGVVACWIPALRAARIDPVITMRA
jgi:putative ABC transport system permease protein